MQVFRLFALVFLSLIVCVAPAAAIVPDEPFDPLVAVFLLVFLLTLACIGSAIAGALTTLIFLLLERLPLPRVRAALPPLLLVLIAAAARAGVWDRYTVPFSLDLSLPLAMAVLTPWPLVASRFGDGRRPWYLVLVAAITTALLVGLNFFPLVNGPGEVASVFPDRIDAFIEIGEMFCVACVAWSLMVLLGRFREGEYVFLLAPLLVFAWLFLGRGAPAHIFPEGALLAGGVASLFLALAAATGRRWVPALALVAAALAVAWGYAALLTSGGAWFLLNVALFIVLMLALGTAGGLLLVRPKSLPWCMGAAFAAPLLVSLGYMLAGGDWWEVWRVVGSSVPSLLGLCAVSVLVAVVVGGVARWVEREKQGG